MTLDELLDLLEDVKPAGNGYVALCPAHDDRNKASLSVTEGEDRLLLYCHAGCEQDAILEALGKTWRDIVYNASPNYAEPEAIYEYVDEAGEPLFQALRFPGKKFKQRHWDPFQEEADEGCWVWNLDGVRRTLYRLPEVSDAVREGRTVYIVEGEKDVESLRAIGKTATCNPGGAGKWRDEYAEFLRGAKVIIVADRDDPGRTHAEKVKQSLQGLAEVIWVYQAKVGKDVSDHLAAGLTIEEMVPLKSAVRRGILTARELAEGAREDLGLTERDIPGYVLMDAIPLKFRQGRMYAVGAYTGDGKSTYALQGSRTLCENDVKVGYASLEMPERDLRNKILAQKGIPFHLLEEPWRIRLDPSLYSTYLDALQELEEWSFDIVFESNLTADRIAEYSRDREWDAVVVDHVHRFGWGRERRQLESEVQKLTNLALEQNVMVLILCQLRKHYRGKDFESYPIPSLQDFRETSQIADDASLAIALWRQRDEQGLKYTGTTLAIVLKNRHTTGKHDTAGHQFFPHFDTRSQMYLVSPREETE